MKTRPRFCRYFMLLAALGWLAATAFGQSAEELRATVGRSLVLDYPTDIGRISTSNPEIVDAMAVTTREILLHAKGHGNATVIVWSKNGQRTFYNITVEHNLEPIRKILKATFPGEEIQVQSARDSVALVGRVSTSQIAERAGALVTPLARTVLNNLSVTPTGVEKQVLLRVKFAEVGHTVASNFGVNLASVGALNTIGRTTTGQFPGPSPSQITGSIPGKIEGTTSSFTLSDALNVFAFRPDLNLAAFVAALQGQGVLQILAEPNLVTTNGKEASFLVGGEFPVPVLQGGGNSGAVTVQFREFGIRLNFLPTVTENRTIRLYVKPEVSTIDMSNAVVFNGFTIPALSTRRMETNIELAEGQSFAIGGLIDDRVTESMSKVPGLANIPILGMLFKSRRENKSKSELVVLVTPEVTTPLAPPPLRALPTMPKPFMTLPGAAKQVGAASPEKPKVAKGKAAPKSGRKGS